MFLGAIGLGNGLFSSDRSAPPAGVSDFTCSGNETRLAECPSMRVLGERCETASAVCQGKQYCIGQTQNSDANWWYYITSHYANLVKMVTKEKLV